MKFLFTLLLPWLVVSAAARRIPGRGESPYERYEGDKAKVTSWGYEQKYDNGGGYRYEIQTKLESPKEESKPKYEGIRYESEYKYEEPKYESKNKNEGLKEESKPKSEGTGNESKNKNVEPKEKSNPKSEDYKDIEPKYESKSKSEGHHKHEDQKYEGENKHEAKNQHEGYKYEEPKYEPIYRKVEVTGHEDKYDETKEGDGLKYVKYEKYNPLILGRFGLGFDKRTASSTGLQQPLTVDYELVVVGRDYWGRCRSIYKDPAGDYIFCVPVRQ